MKIGLALGGGGARGAAHVGVLMELEAHGIRPHLITGTSIGGLVGALYAAGLSTADLAHFFAELNLTHLYGLPGGAPAFAGNNKIEKLLEQTLGRITFADLQIPLAVVTVDLVSRKTVILDEGDLITAVLATIALPIVLPPIEWEGMALVDGGLLNNVPFDIARARGATYVIAVALERTTPYGAPVELPPLEGGVLERALALTQRRRTWQILSVVADIITGSSLHMRLAISQPDLLLQPHMGTIGLFDFHRWQAALEKGRAAAHEVEAELRAIGGG